MGFIDQNWRIAARVRSHTQKAVRLGLEATLTRDEWKEILIRANGCCTYCQKYVGDENLRIEHMIPMAYGGGHTKDNVAPACDFCNNQKVYLEMTAYHAGEQAFRDGEPLYLQHHNTWCQAYSAGIKGARRTRIYASWEYGWQDERRRSLGRSISFPPDKERYPFVVPSVNKDYWEITLRRDQK